MLIYRRTSLFESNAQTLVNTVNCVGVMGKGIAKTFKERDPAMYAAYRKICERDLLAPGKLWLWQGSNGWVLNFPTKIHWRNPSKLEWIEAGLQKFSAEYAARGIREISFPRLGCGNGNLDWNDVRPLMERYLADLNIPVYVHDYTVDVGLPEHLEAVACQLRLEGELPTTFEIFMRSLKRASEVSGGNLVQLESREPFNIGVTDEGNLNIRASSGIWTLENDDLRGVWLSLSRGLITHEEAGWSDIGSGDAVMSTLSVLPHIRPIQIQIPSKAPELALELTSQSGRTAPAPLPGGSTLFSWA